MRKMILSVAVMLGLTTVLAAQKQETLEGNGKVVTREVAVSGFNELEANGVFQLKLIQGNKEGVKIEADENLQEYFTVSNKGNKLIIDTKKLKNKNLKNKNTMKVYVTFTTLKNLELRNVGNVSTEGTLSFNDINLETSNVGNIQLNFNAAKVNLHNKSVGNVTLKGKAQTAVMKSQGVGNIEAGSFVVQTMDIENSGVGNAEVNAEKELKVRDNMLGKVRNRGAAPVRKKNRVVI